MDVRYSYLSEQFADSEEILGVIRQIVERGDFTLGREVREFEDKFAELVGRRHAIGVASGTDALKLSMKALGIGPGDEVITVANTFVSTVAAVTEVGATPRLVDCNDSFCIDVDLIEPVISPATKAILPVHLTGNVADMKRIMDIADAYGLVVVEDACQALCASRQGKQAGAWGNAAAFSFHPLKALNVWGDGGMIVTDDSTLDERLRILRNNGVRNRDEVVTLGYNSRLDTIQAAVGLHLIDKTREITRQRQSNADYYDECLSALPGISIPPREADVEQAFHLYMVFAEERDSLNRWCQENGVRTKVHYPTPLYRQEGLKPLGYLPGTFPVTDRHSQEVISLPVDQFLSQEQLEKTVHTLFDFYGRDRMQSKKAFS